MEDNVELIELEELEENVKVDDEVTEEELLLEDEADDALLELIVPLVLDEDEIGDEAIWEEVLVGDGGIEDDVLDVRVDVTVVLERLSVIEG